MEQRIYRFTAECDDIFDVDVFLVGGDIYLSVSYLIGDDKEVTMDTWTLTDADARRLIEALRQARAAVAIQRARERADAGATFPDDIPF